ncbi:effector-associated constant component EACC1 [Planosporangium sp. 12N6]|uniref:effector-associated constant component EACC1 n=1 Tax=Planosporangium spinosum TaxID=3402278 RepID=UPI003CF13575
MQVRVRVAGGSVDEYRSLLSWLRDEPEVRRHGQLTAVAGDTGAGQMGTALDVLTLVVGSGLSAAQLAFSIIMWRASRDQPVRVILEHDGRAVPVDTTDPGAAEAIAAKLEAD